jgi:hypothetical protein
VCTAIRNLPDWRVFTSAFWVWANCKRACIITTRPKHRPHRTHHTTDTQRMPNAAVTTLVAALVVLLWCSPLGTLSFFLAQIPPC